MTKPWYEALYEHFPDYDQEPYTQNTQGEVDFIAREIRHDRSLRILDVGCGTGRHALELARRGYTVVGIDLSESLLAQARRTAEDEGLAVTFLARDARALAFDAEFDVVILMCEGAFSLMETDEMDRQILEQVARALKPGGRFLMTTPNAAHMIAHDPGEVQFDLVTLRETFTLETTGADGAHKVLDCTQRYYTCPELRWLLKGEGFEPVEFFAVTGEGFQRAARPSREEFELGVIAVKTRS
jgi:2-polyprenyl-3-methyl-5-hydroxy-6-metoxy-1,4-benzoquinol methylase